MANNNDFQIELRALLGKHMIDIYCRTRDVTLVDYIVACLTAYRRAFLETKDLEAASSRAADNISDPT